MRVNWPSTLLLVVWLAAMRDQAHAAAPPATADHSLPDNSPEIAAALEEYTTGMAARRWEDALAPAQRMVELARPAAASAPLVLADALTRLGTAQFALREYPAAEASFAEAAQLREKQGGSLDRGLEEPLRGLGFSLARMDRHAEAVAILERALLINQRYQSLFDLSQQTLREQLGLSLTELGQMAVAEQQFRNILRAGEEEYGLDDPRLARQLNLVGAWYASHGSFLAARSLYRRGIELVEKHEGATSPRLLRLLRNDVRSYTRELIYANNGYAVPLEDGSIRPLRRTRLPEEGEESLLHALTVLAANGNQPATQYTDTLIQAGDWFLLKMQPEVAKTYYLRAWNSVFSRPGQAPEAAGGGSPADDSPADDPSAAASSMPAAPVLASAPLSYPEILHYVVPPAARRFRAPERPPDAYRERFVVVEMTIDAAGLVVEPMVVEQDATDRMVRETLKAIRDAQYRPRYENGAPVSTTGVRYRQTFKELK